MTVLLSVRTLEKRFRGVVATDRLDFELPHRELHAIIGPNGAGKTTFIHQISGELRPDAGTIMFDGKDITRDRPDVRAQAGIARTYQITSVFAEFTALENVMMAALAGIGGSFSFWSPVQSDRELTEPATSMLDRVGLKPLAHVAAGVLAHGERKQLELAMALVTRPKLLLLDEPMGGMSQIESKAMIAILQSLKGTCGIILVEHDMDAVFALADRITVLVYGRVIASGTPAEVRASAAVREAYLGEEEDSE